MRGGSHNIRIDDLYEKYVKTKITSNVYNNANNKQMEKYFKN